MTEHEMAMKKLKALESIAQSLRSIDFYLKIISEQKDRELQILSCTGAEVPPTCPECGHEFYVCDN